MAGSPIHKTTTDEESGYGGPIVVWLLVVSSIHSDVGINPLTIKDKEEEEEEEEEEEKRIAQDR